MALREPSVRVYPSSRATSVPVWPESMLPSRFVAVVDLPGQPYRAALDVRVTERGAELMTLSLEVRDWIGSSGITAEGLRRVRVAELLRDAVAAAAVPVGGEVEHFKGGQFRLPGDPPEVVRGSYALTPGGFPDSTPPGRGRRMPEDFVQRVAEVYRQAVRARVPDPVAQVGRTLHGSRSSAGRWVLQARRRGLLGPARGRTAGELGDRQVVGPLEAGTKSSS